MPTGITKAINTIDNNTDETIPPKISDNLNHK